MQSKLTRRQLLGGAAALAGLGILSACGGGTTSPAASTPAASGGTTTPTAGATTGGTTTPAASSGTTTTKATGRLTFWHSYASGGGAEGEALQQILAKVKTEMPELQLTVLEVPFDQLFNKFETEAAAGGGPDMYIAPNDSLGKQARAKLLMPLDDKLAGKLNNILPVAVDGSKVDGKLYAVPESLKAVAMFYNTDKVKEAPKTTDALLTAVKGGTKIGINQNAYHNYGFFGAFGGKLFDASNKCTAADTGFTEAMQYLKDLKAAGAQFFTDGNKLGDSFQTRQLDAVIEGPWKTGDFKKALGNKLNVAAIPAGPKGAATPLTGVDGWYINANTKNADSAIALALYTVAPAQEKIFVDVAGHVPADKTIEITDPITKGFANSAAGGFPRPQSAEFDKFWDPFGNMVNKIMDANTDPKTAVTEACAAMNKANNK